MQLIQDGPDIPNDLANLIMSDNAVFFCGAGVSRNEGLPDFRQLAQAAVDLLGPHSLTIARPHLKHSRYDAALQLVYDRVPHTKLANLLKQKLTFRNGASLGAHRAVLKLAKHRTERRSRIVTTNFDDGFRRAACLNGDPTSSDVAPRLPPVRNDWWTLVALHGELESDNIANLVLTSGQFGRAYMTEGWAARFVAELFRRFTVVFIGYSIDDPVMRYVVDAYRAVDPIGEVQTYAFVGSSITKKQSVIAEWKAKHVEPIWYRIDRGDHGLLYNSLCALSQLKQKGTSAPQAVLRRYCTGPADLLTTEDRTQVFWAMRRIEDKRDSSSSISSPSESALKAVAQCAPSSITSWIRLIQESGLDSSCALVARWPRLTSEIWTHGALSEHEAVGRWICSHLASRDLVDWAIEGGGYISPVSAGIISRHISSRPGPYEDAWRFLCKMATNPPYWVVNQISPTFDVFSSSSVDEKAAALVAITLPAIGVQRSYLYTKEEITTASELLHAEITLPVDESPIACLKALREDPQYTEVIRTAATGLLARLDELGKVILRIQEGLGAVPYGVQFDHSPISDLSSDDPIDDWQIIPFVIGELFGLLYECDRRTLAERIRHWLSASHSIVHDRLAFRTLGMYPLLPPDFLADLLSARSDDLLSDQSVRNHLRRVLSRYQGRWTNGERRKIGQLITNWSRTETTYG